MIKKITIFLALFVSIFQLHAQDTIPHLKGRVDISIAKGTFDCNFTLSNIPKINDYYIRLNTGMNIRFIKNGNGTNPLHFDKSLQDTMSSGESSAYFLPAYNDFGKFLPRTIQFSYVGMYPVITDTVSVVDWKGNIAFNGKTLRTDGFQSAWYPVLYDVKRDITYDKVSYEIEVNCLDCKTIYVNGNPPVEATHALFKTELPQELTLFSGNYRMVAMNGNYFLNPDMDDSQLKQFEEVIRSYKSYYEKNLLIPYKGNAVYIQTTPVSKHNAWLFASYPTIVNIGFGEYGMKTFFDKKKGDEFKPYMAHELGHYYFGAYRAFNSELGDMISEGFSEFLSLQVTKKMISDSVYAMKLESKKSSLGNFKATPFSAIKSKNDYNNRELYVYYYAPLIFTAIQKEIGEQNMWKWIRLILQKPASFTNYRFLEQTLSEALANKEKFDLIKEKYFISDSVMKNVSLELGLTNGAENIASPFQQSAKTYYYFFFSGPATDAGSPESKTIKYSEIHEITCTPSELSKMAQPIFKRIKEECENEAGCSSDFNTYETSESAKSALTRWLKPYLVNPSFIIKKIAF